MQRIKIAILGALLAMAVGVFSGFVRRIRINWHEIEALKRANQPFIIGCWHNNILYGAPLLARLRLWSTTSLSKDGDLTTSIFSWYGIRFIRGSSSRGATALLRGAISLLKRKESIYINFDGPRGPRYSVKPGVVMMAYKAQVPIVPLCISAEKRWQFNKSWDAMRLPKLFSRTAIMVGTPIWPKDLPTKAGGREGIDIDVPAACEQIRETMLQLYRRTEQFSGAKERYPDIPLWADIPSLHWPADPSVAKA